MLLNGLNQFPPPPCRVPCPLPRLPRRHVPGSKAFLVLELSRLKGKDLAEMDARVMGMGGGSDPYVVVHTDPPCVLASEPVKSRTITHDLNPDWGDDKLTLKLSTHDVEGTPR